MVIFNSEDDAKTTIQVTELDIVYNNKIKASDRTKISSSRDVYSVLMKDWNMGKIELQEQFKVIFLDRKNSCLGITTVASGGITGVHVDLRLIFAMALKASATGIILAHNHPSGQLSPSNADISLTKRFSQAGSILDIAVLDHMIVTKEGYKSFADEGLLDYVEPSKTLFSR